MIRIDVTRKLAHFKLDATFEADSAGITALFGRSGAGKTSIVNMLAGLLRPDSGCIEIDGRVLFDHKAGINLPPHKRRLGYVFQESRLFPHYTVRGNLTYGMNRRDEAARKIDFDTVVDVLGIGHLLERRPRALSGGEKQRVALGRALLTSPELLLMDEPLASLDAPRKQEVLPLIEALRDRFNVPIVYVTHSMDEIVRLADTLVLIDEGKVAAVGPIEELTSRLDLRPLTGRYEAGSVIAARIAGHDSEYALSLLEFAGGTFRVPRIDLPVGARLRVRIRARDVSLAVKRPEGFSDLNVIPGTVEQIGGSVEDASAPDLDLRLDIGSPLWVRISRRAFHDLGLAEGSSVFAVIKGTSIDRLSLSRLKTGDEQSDLTNQQGTPT
ncbi:MAG: molybdenum ABC transporter ATP-binding protein [Alphaproteobacteria bacterium]